MNHSENYGLWVVMMCQCSFVLGKKCTLLVDDVDNGEEISNVGYSSFTIATCTLVDPDRCTKYFGYCRRHCFKYERQIDICLSPSKICCIERLFEED
ncbi:beta-defensin 114 [Mirounga angustirostris]|uniref:beta-defensin 114 n=1 Tax=Mirounga angustirostris TaxID=9716 RepID=UPI001E68DE3E|nr:beta-defensin 114 [Mirounga angustirostris]